MLNNMLSTLLFALAATSAQAASQGHRKLVELATLPVQTFFIPFKEDDIFWNMFHKINSGRATAPVESTIALAFSTDNTVIWFDHWEDGFELDVTNATQSTTEIWGDHNAANGCAPKVVPCTDSADVIRSGQSLVINNTVPIPRIKSDFFYDGGDRMQASYPITVTRGAYPTVPGSLMAGATDIIETENWGKNFEAPTGRDVGATFNVFEYSGLFFMAANDNTTVTLPNKTKVLLNRGESSSVLVNQADTLSADDIIQVHLITGDVMSFYEMRWYSLLPNEAWSTEYLSPVGDSHGRTKMFLYNPGTTSMDIVVTTINTTSTKTLAPKKSAWTDVIFSGTGASVKSKNNGNFLALALTDTENRTSVGQWTLSEWYDWGFTVLPTNILTPQVLIGWGYACTNNNCFGQKDRSVIWVTPMEDADIYIDHKNTGTNQSVFFRRKMTSSKFVDTDQDMSGALIFATAPGSGVKGRPIDIAAAWGQDPSVSRDMQAISLDLGTVIRPFPNVRAHKSVDRPTARPGEILTYTIKLVNMGQVDLPRGSLRVFDVLDSMVSYIPGSAKIAYNVGGTEGAVAAAVADNAPAGTPFPLDETGYVVNAVLPKRGGAMDITFDVKIDGAIVGTHVINNGEVKQPFGNPIPFDATTELLFDPLIALDNKVYLGDDKGASCGTDAAVEFVEDIVGSDVVYCFNVTNTGNTFLTNFTLEDMDLLYTNNTLALLPPGNSTMVYFKSTIDMPLKNMANVSATPAFKNGAGIPALPRVSASDPSEVGTLIPAPSVSIDNKVALENDKALCGTEFALEYVENYVGSAVTYCFNVTNTGNTYLDSVAVNNEKVVFTNSSTGLLAPGESRMIAVPATLAAALKNDAVVVANPVFKTGKDIPGLDDVTDTDPSEVGIITIVPKVNIENTVYAGNQEGFCHTDRDSELAEGANGDDVIFCFVITNTGDSHLNISSVKDPVLGFTKQNLGMLAPKESITVSYPSKINGDKINNATVIANPVFPDGKDIPFLKDVTDTDPSEVKEMAGTANITIQNTVYLGTDNGAACPGAELVEDKKNASIVYCFYITNTGTTFLKLLSLDNKELAFTQTSFAGILPPGESVLVSVPKTIDANLTNIATVVANPVNAAGQDIAALSDVSASDPSAVAPKNDGTPREFYKPDDPTSNKTCMDNAYEDAFNISDALVCTSKEVYLEKVDSIAKQTCEPGQIINVDIDASIRFTSARFDLGWYVATDGGDALDGQCVNTGLKQGATYNVVDRPGSSKVVGSVNWNADAVGGADACGDLLTTPAGAGGNIDKTPITVALPVVCTDENKNGKLDVAICFTWRNEANDGVCTMKRDDPLTKGRLSDMYPGQVQGCYCERYEIPSITVVPPVVPPC